MSYQGKKSIPHITVSRAPAPPRAPPVSVQWGVGAAGDRPGSVGEAGQASCGAAGGAGPGSALEPPPPQPLGTMGGRGSPAWRGGAGASGPFPRGLAAASPAATAPRPLRRGMCQRMVRTGRMRS